MKGGHEEQDILSKVEPIMQSLRRIGIKDPLSVEDQSYIVDHVLNHHPEKVVRLVRGLIVLWLIDRVTLPGVVASMWFSLMVRRKIFPTLSVWKISRSSWSCQFKIFLQKSKEEDRSKKPRGSNYQAMGQVHCLFANFGSPIGSLLVGNKIKKRFLHYKKVLFYATKRAMA